MNPLIVFGAQLAWVGRLIDAYQRGFENGVAVRRRADRFADALRREEMHTGFLDDD